MDEGALHLMLLLLIPTVLGSIGLVLSLWLLLALLKRLLRVLRRELKDIWED